MPTHTAPLASNISQSQSLPSRAFLDKLPDLMKRQIADSLSNDENSSDAELLEFWCQDCAIPEEAAKEAIGFRECFYKDPMFELFPVT